MPFEVKLLSELSAIEIRLWDRLTAEELRSAASSVMESAERTGFRRALADCRDYLGGPGLGEVYFLTRDVTNRPASVRGPEAFVAPTDDYARADVQFYVEAARSLGTRAELFPTREEAIEWLIATGHTGEPGPPADSSRSA